MYNSSPNNNTSPMRDSPKKLKSSFGNIRPKSSFSNLAKAYSNNLYYNTGFGQSKYDKSFNFDAQFNELDPQGSLNEHRAQTQSGWVKAGAGVARVGLKVATEVAKMPGFIGGAIAAPFAEEGEGWETMVNNSWVKSLNNFNEEINDEYLPVYVKKAISEGNLWDNITSIDFWAKDGADGMGYILSMMLPGAALKGLGAGKYLSQIKGLKGVLSAQKADVITGTVANTLFEASAEAGNAMENFQKEMDNKLTNGQITPEQYETMKLQKAKLGRDIFLANAVILAGPNALQANMLWGKGLNKSMSKLIDAGDGSLAKTVVEPKWYQKVANRGKDLVKAGFSEGVVEEAGQMTVENMFTNSARQGKLTDNPFNDFNVSELGEAYLDTISSVEGQKAMFLGAFLGGGMQAYSGMKTDIADRKSTQSLLDAGNNAIDAFYKTMQKDLYNEDGSINESKVKEKFEAFGRIEQLNILYNNAVEKQDKEALEKLRDLAATQLAYGFIMNEDLGLEVLKEHLETSSQFDEIVQREQQAGNNVTKKDIIENVMSKAKVLESAYRNFNDFAPSLITPTLKEGQTQNDVINFTNTLRSNYLSNKANIHLNENTLNDLKIKRQNILKDLELDSNLVIGDETIQEQEQNDERLKQITQDIKETETHLNRLKKLDRNFWNKEHIQKAFDRSNKEIKKLEEEISPEIAEANEETIVQIDNAETIEELENLEKTTTNPIIKAKIQVKKENLAEELLNQRNLEIGTEEVETTITNEENEENSKLLKETIENKKIGDTILNPFTNTEETIENIDKNFVIINGKTYEFDSELTDDGSAEDVDISNINKTPEFTNDAKTPGMSNNIEYINYLKEPRNKKGDVVTFEINFQNLKEGSEQDKAIKVYEKIKNGEQITSNERVLLINSLPINFIFNNSVTSWSAFKTPGAVSLRTSIANALRVGHKLENLITTVTNQENADFNNLKDENGKSVKNNVLEIDYIKNQLNSNVEDLTLYHVNMIGQAVLVSDSSKSKDAIDVVTKNNMLGQKGQILVMIKHPKGHNVPVKLNNNKLSPVKASSLARLYSEILNNNDLLNNTLDYFNTNTTKELYEEFSNSFKEEIKLLGKGKTEFTNISELIEILVYEKGKNSIVIKKDENNISYLTYKDQNYYSQDIEQLGIDLANKVQHVITLTTDSNVVKNINFKNPKYLKYLFDNKILTTDLDVENGSFLTASKDGKKGSELWINSSISVKKEKTIKSTSTSQFNIEAKKADIERRRKEELDKNSGTSNIINLPTQNEQEARSKGEKILKENKKLVEQLEKEFTNEDETLFNELVEKLEKLLSKETQGEVSFGFKEGKIFLTIDKVKKGNVINSNYTNSRKGQIGEFEVGDNVQVNNGSVSIPSTVTKVSSTGRIIEAQDKNGTITIRNGVVLGSNVIQREKEINAKYDAELKALEEPVVTKTTTVEEKNLFIQDKLKEYKDLIAKKLKDLSSEDVVEGKLIVLNSEGNFVESDVMVTYRNEGFIFKNNLISYEQMQEKFKNSLENIWNSQNNFVSLQNNPKIENDSQIKDTEDNMKLNEEFKKLSDEDLNKKNIELSNILEVRKKALEITTDETLKLRLTSIIEKLEKELKDVSKEIETRKKCK